MGKILIIDDHSELRENICEILEYEKYEVLSAENGQKGIATATREIPDLILCDITMPGLDGFDVLLQLHNNELTNGIPFIFLTAQADLPSRTKGIADGANDYIIKPVDPTLLLTTIEARLKKREKEKTEIREIRQSHINALEKMLFITSHEVRKPIASCLGLMNLFNQADKIILRKEELKRIFVDLQFSMQELDDFMQQLTNYMFENKLKEMNDKEGNYNSAD